MPAYAYPIKIKKARQTIHFDETKRLENDCLTLADLQFVGADDFSICLPDDDWATGYIVNVSRTRLETDEERNNRVQKEESYMAEYTRRHPAK